MSDAMTATVREAFSEAASTDGRWTSDAYSVHELRGRAPGLRVWAGRSSDGSLSAFFEATDSAPVRLDVSRVISCTSTRISNELGEELRVVQVQCQDSRLNEVFFTFLSEVLTAMDVGQPLVAALGSTATEWRSLLALAMGGIGETQMRGLFGELHVLVRAVERLGPSAIDRWTGPDGGRHDFLGSGAGLEVKTALLQNRQAVTIHGLRQLEPVEGMTLTLAVAEVESQPEGRTLNDLVDALLDLGVGVEPLRSKLAAVGFVRGMPGSETGFNLVDMKFWEITGTTPVLRRGVLPEEIVNAVSDLSYSLDLGSLGPDFAAEFDFERLALEGEA